MALDENPMRKYILGLGLAVFAAGLMGCVSANPDGQFWVGHAVSELIASWGPAEQVIYVGDGNRMYVWSSTRTARGNVSAYGPSQTVWVSPGGEVYRWARRPLDSKAGSKVEPVQANVSTP
jgi:hypothetical protein